MSLEVLLTLVSYENVQLIVASFIVLRIIHRLYYVSIGQKHYFSFDPKSEMEKFLKKNDITLSDGFLTCKRDRVKLRYRVLGKGPKKVLLLNGVGTNFWMWRPVIEAIVNKDKDFFDKVTLFVPSYRGLFGSDAAEEGDAVEITMDNCVKDVVEMMEFLNIKKYDTIIGWSMGAQTAITCCASHPEVADKLFLLNPSTGLTLHFALQAIFPLPLFIGKNISAAIRGLRTILNPLCNTIVWRVLGMFFTSPIFRLVLEVSAFLGGFPPGQPVYFAGYMKDVFNNPNQTKGLLDLIVALDAPCPPNALCLPHKAVIVSGLPDVMTGVYHSTKLAEGMKSSRHVMFTMGSHFVLIEWPDLVAVEILALVNN